MVVEFGVFDIAEIFNVEKPFRLCRAELGNDYRLVLTVDNVVPGFHILADSFELAVYLFLFLGELLVFLFL